MPINGKNPQILRFPLTVGEEWEKKGVLWVVSQKKKKNTKTNLLFCTRQQKHIHVPLYPVSSASGFLSHYPRAGEHPRAESSALGTLLTWLLTQCTKFRRAPKAAGSLGLSAIDLWCLHLLSSTCQHYQRVKSSFLVDSPEYDPAVGFLWELLYIRTHITKSPLTQHHFVLCDPSQKRQNQLLLTHVPLDWWVLLT